MSNVSSGTLAQSQLICFCVRCFVQGHFSEKDAAEKMQSLLDFIAYAHSKNIIHRCAALLPAYLLLCGYAAMQKA